MFELLGVSPQALFGQLLLGLINGAFYALLSLGLAVIFGMLNVINFTHGAQYMMGAFGAWMMLQYVGIPYWGALVLVADRSSARPASSSNGCFSPASITSIISMACC